MLSVPKRVLLTGATSRWRRTDLPTGQLPVVAGAPRSYADLERNGQIIANGQFRKGELPTARRLWVLGIPVVPVDTRGGRFGSSPDAALVAARATVELKRRSSYTGIADAFKTATTQSRRIVLDVVGSAIRERTALDALTDQLLQMGGNFDEAIIIGHGFGILWP